MAYKAIQARETITKEKGIEPSIEEIAKAIHVDTQELILSFDAIQTPVSLQEPLYKDGTENIFVMDQVKDNKNTDERWTENLSIAEAMKRLTKREKDIISKRFFEGRTQMEVAREIGISQESIGSQDGNR